MGSFNLASGTERDITMESQGCTPDPGIAQHWRSRSGRGYLEIAADHGHRSRSLCDDEDYIKKEIVAAVARNTKEEQNKQK